MASDCFNYDCPEPKLQRLVRSILALDAPGRAGADNNYEDPGQRNAATLMKLLNVSVSVELGQQALLWSLADFEKG